MKAETGEDRKELHGMPNWEMQKGSLRFLEKKLAIPEMGSLHSEGQRILSDQNLLEQQSESGGVRLIFEEK